MESPNERNDWRRALSMLVFSWNVLRYLLQHVRRGDVVIGSRPQLLSALASRIASFVRGAPFILEVRDLWPESLTVVSGRSSPLAIGLRFIADLLYRTSAAVIILAEGNREPIVQHGGPEKRIVFIPNGVNLADFNGELRDLPDSLRWVAANKTFVYASSHGPANGLELVLDAAELLKRTEEEVRILLVGDGPSKGELQADAAKRRLDNVVFHPPISKDLIPSLLRRCAGGLMILKDVELFRYGVSPNKLFDYLASDLPVVTNVAGEVALTVEEAKAGIVVPPEDPAALAEAVRQIASHPGDSATGSAYVAAHRDRRVLADRLAQVIDNVRRI